MFEVHSANSPIIVLCNRIKNLASPSREIQTGDGKGSYDTVYNLWVSFLCLLCIFWLNWILGPCPLKVSLNSNPA